MVLIAFEHRSYGGVDGEGMNPNLGPYMVYASQQILKGVATSSAVCGMGWGGSAEE